ncbi:MAG: Peroxisomal membrane signal receptor PTS1 [Pleopsidium flavum]|nr:MAG: Peroxisomal membrane signal receptor PTS1 [Pleopsidium flavum]
MSFLGGAECSTAGNPLTQFTKHVQDDKSLQRDRLVGRGPEGIQEGMRSQGIVGGQDSMMDGFLQQNGQIPHAPVQPFAMEQMRRELENYQTAPQRSGSPGWAAEFDPSEQARMEAAFQAPKHGGFAPSGFTPQEFQRFQQLERNGTQRTASPIPSTHSTMNGYQRPMGMGYGMNMGMGGMGMMGSSYSPMSMQRPIDPMTENKGKGRMVELDERNWEEQFAEIDAVGQQELDAEANAAMEAELNHMDRSVFSETNEFGDFESIWRGIEAEMKTARQMVDDDHLGLSEGMHMGDFDQWDGFDGLNTHGGFRDPQLGDYLFEEDNVFRELGDPFGEGLRIMEEGGNLSLAALAFEAAVAKNPQHIEAWTMLGSAQAQNEKESPAIRALEQALKLDPSNLDALMGLAVSYTNEGYDSTAYRTLERWLATKYPQIIDKSALSSEADVGFTDRHQLHEKVTNLFIQAAQLSPDGEHMDPDVQVGLGVLFYGDEEYAKAVDCFESALASTESGTSNQRQQVHLLWNRLGATLANSGRSEEAIAAYEKALTLNPNFVRARYNLGVSCINIGCYEEAAQHLLGALAMHKVVEREGRERAREVVGEGVDDAELERMMHQNQSTNLYDTLRRVFSQMGRRDLSEAVVAGMDVDIFRGEFDF